MESPPALERPPLPLRVIFEGQSSRLTTLLHTTMATLFFVRIRDLRSFFLVDVDKADGWQRTLLFYVACMMTAAFVGALTVGSLSLNLRPLTKENWRGRICLSIIALMLIDLVVVDTLRFSVELIFGDEKEVASMPATVFISALAIASTVWFNIMYVKMFGCCFCCCCCGEKTIARVLENAGSFNQHNDTLPGEGDDHANISTGAAMTEPRTRDCPGIPETASSPNSHPFRNLFDVRKQDVVTIAEQMRWPNRSLSVPVDSRSSGSAFQAGANSRSPGTVQSTSKQHSTGALKAGEQLELDPSSKGQVNRLESFPEPHGSSTSQPETAQSTSGSLESSSTQIQATMGGFHRWDTMKLVELGSAKLRGHQSQHKRPNSSACEILVEESEKAKTMDETPRATSSKFSIASVVQKFMTGDEDDSTSFDLSRWSFQSVWKLVSQEPGHFCYSVWIKSAFFTSVIILIYTYIRSMSVLTHLSDLYKENRDRFNSNRGDLDVFLVGAGWSNGIDDIEKTTVIKLYSIVDAVALDLKHACWIGYSFGFVVGLYSLVAVLVQHKRISIAVTDGLRAFRNEDADCDEKIESPWRSFQKKYRVLGASRFLGILASTAVVQLHVVGFTISVLICLLKNAHVLSVVMDVVGAYLMAYCILLVINVLLAEFLRSALISEDDKLIIHPRWFNFWMVALSMVHLVIGLLYAVWRLLFLMSTTILSLNRLDVTYFVKGKRLDSGHNAFMSMLVLTVLVQEDHESFAVHPGPEPTSN